MNLPSEAGAVSNGALGGTAGQLSETPARTGAMAALLATESRVSPFEFRSLAGEEMKAAEAWFEAQSGQAGVNGRRNRGFKPWETGGGDGGDGIEGSGYDCVDEDAMHRSAVDTARQEGVQAGEREGRRAMRAEMEAQMHASVAQERERLAGVVKKFGALREQYFSAVEQEVVKLALAIAARVLHREAQIDPLLLAGAVRVALETMKDRSGVELRVAQADVTAWQEAFAAEQPSERPLVVEDARLERGECVLETRMGTVELGVGVQLEEIEKGFFDLLRHRPVE